MAITWTKKFGATDDGAVLTGAQVGQLQDDIDSSLSAGSSWASATTNIKTSSYNITTADIGKLLIANKTTALTFTLFDITGDEVVIIKNIGAGTLTIACDASDTTEVSTVAQYQSTVLVSDGTNNVWRAVVLPTSGSGYSTTFANSGVDAYNQTVLYPHGSDGAVSLIAQSGQTVTFAGTAAIDTAQYAYKGASIVLDGNSDYVSVPNATAQDITTGQAYIAIGVRFAALPTNGNAMSLCSKYVGATNYFNVDVYNNAGTYQVRLQFYSGSARELTFDLTSLAIDTNYMIELSIDSVPEARAFLNGTLQGAATAVPASILQVTAALVFGAYNSGSYLNGWLLYAVYCVGASRYTATHTARTSPWLYKYFRANHALNIAYTNTMLMNGDGIVVIPDEIAYVDLNNIDIEMTSFGTLLGTYKVRVS